MGIKLSQENFPLKTKLRAKKQDAEKESILPHSEARALQKVFFV